MNELIFTCENESQTQELARAFVPLLHRGDLFALTGELGAGKTFFVRALIRAAAHNYELEVPSPTFTLVQHYDVFNSNLIISHFDLYRLESPSELAELGLDEALEGGVAFVEWASKGNINAKISIKIEIGKNDVRHFHISGCEVFLTRLARSLEIEDFLQEAGVGFAHRSALAGDASSRRYETIYTTNTQILMDMPTDAKQENNSLAADIQSFIAIDILLRKNNFRAPEIYAHNYKSNLILLEHLGSELIKDKNNKPIVERYEKAIETLVEIQKINWQKKIKLPKNKIYEIGNYTAEIFQAEACLLPQWYVPYKLGGELTNTQYKEYETLWQNHLTTMPKDETLVLRDYHSPNILWLEKQTNKIAVIDFQDALFGTAAYDVASLTHDARINIDEKLEAHLVDLYCKMRKNFDVENFLYSLKLMQAQRASKILGIFVRLAKRDGKKNYLQYLPQVENYLSRALSHKKLADLKKWYEKVLAL